MAEFDPVSTGLGFASQGIGLSFSRSDAADARAATAEMVEEGRRWSQFMRQTAYQDTVKDMQKAGINPMLAYMKGPSDAPGGGAGSAPIGRGAGGSLASDIHSAAQAQLMAAQQRNIDADTERKQAETREIGERTPTHAVSIEQMRQNIQESIARIGKIEAETVTTAAQGRHYEQQITNLQAALPQIEATIRLLKAQEKQTGSMTGLTIEQTKDLRQKIAQNLPQLEREVQNLRMQLDQQKLPQAQQDAAMSQKPLGTAAAILRLLNPLRNW